jgi:tRNA 2-thiouridine synthesizing protein C
LETDVSQSRKKLLLVLRRAPYGDTLARASLDVALAAAAFDQQVELLFMDDGVWQLLPAQQPTAIGAKNLYKTLQSMPLYDIESFYVEADSLAQRQLSPDQLECQVQLLEAEDLPVFMDSFDQVLGF